MSDVGEIPVLDVEAPDFAGRVVEACRDIGFFSLTGHGIDPSCFDDMRRALDRLFACDDATKRRGAITREDYRGFIPLGFFTPNRAEVTGDRPDTYEGYKLHWECSPERARELGCELYGPNRWPAHVPELRETVLDYWARCDALAARLLDVFADDLGVDRSTLAGWHADPLTNMTLLRYPAGAAASTDDVGFHPHKDTNVITILHPGPVAGLEIRGHDGGWIRPDAPDHAVLVNIGEMLELWSGGRYVATPHRVRPPAGADRYSFPWFLVPAHHVVVEPLVPCAAGFDARSMPVGALSAEVWRTNWPDEVATDGQFDLGSLDR